MTSQTLGSKYITFSSNGQVDVTFFNEENVAPVISSENNSTNEDNNINSQSSGDDPSLTMKITKSAGNGSFQLDFYSTKTKEGKSPIDFTYNYDSRKLESTTFRMFFGNTVSYDIDGSVIYGSTYSPFSFGYSPQSWFIIDISIPWFGESTNVGTTLYLNKLPWQNIGNSLMNSINVQSMPVSPYPLLLPAFAY